MDYRLSEDLIRRLHVYLEEWDLTQAELAEAVGINISTMNQWLLGRRVALTERSEDGLRRLCRRSGVRFEQALELLSDRKAA